MGELIAYGVGFFIVTMCLQPFLHKVRKNGNMGQSALWTGYVTVITICVLGIVMKNVSFFGALIGFIVADQIGKMQGWHD